MHTIVYLLLLEFRDTFRTNYIMCIDQVLDGVRVFHQRVREAGRPISELAAGDDATVAAQIRAARASLRWSAQKLADESGVSWTTIQRMESAEDIPSATVRSLKATQDALENAGVIFTDADEEGPGVRLRGDHAGR